MFLADPTRLGTPEVCDMPDMMTGCGTQEVATRSEDRPAAGRSGAAMVALPPGHKYSAVSIGGYAEYPNTSQEDNAPPVTRREIIDAYGFDMVAGKWETIQYAAGETPAVSPVPDKVTLLVHVPGGECVL